MAKNIFLKWFRNFIPKKYFKEDIKTYQNLKNKPILFVRNLTKKYHGKKQPAINKLNFDVNPGEFHAFIGGNGAGKTTTIKSLIGAYSNWSGTVLINGIKNNKQTAKKKLGYIPENARFPEKFSAFEYLLWMVMLSGFSRKDAKQIAEQKLKEFDMWNLRRKSPNSFSSGQKKKILLAQALIHDPDIIIMDEPVANLDPKSRIQFFDKLLELKKQNKAIFISSHVLAELDIYADSATVLDGGKIVYSGSKQTLLKRYTTDKYAVKTENDNIAKNYFKQKKIMFEESIELQSLLVHFKNQTQIKNFQRSMLAKKNVLLKFEQMQPTLDEVYKKLVILGSVDTMKKINNDLK